MEQNLLYGGCKISFFYSCGCTYILFWWDGRTATSSAAIGGGEGEEYRVILPQRQESGKVIPTENLEEAGSEVEKLCLDEFIFQPFSGRPAQWNKISICS